MGDSLSSDFNLASREEIIASKASAIQISVTTPINVRIVKRLNFDMMFSRITSVLSERRPQFADERRSDVKY